MFVKFVGIYFGILFAMSASGFNMRKKSYDITLISFNGNGTNSDLLKCDLRLEFIRRGEYGLSGIIQFNFEYADTEFLEVKAYHSATGGNQYKLLPFGFKNMSMKNEMSTYYKAFVMKPLANCSNSPQAEGNEIPMYVVNTAYILDKCPIIADTLPSYMDPGYYKFVVLLSGVVEFAFEVVAKVELKV